MTVSAHLDRAIIEAVERAGVPREAYLDGARISEERLRDEAERFSVADFGRLQTLALDLTGDDALGLHLAEHANEASFDVVGHLVSHAITLREAVAVASRFGALLVSDFALDVSERIDVARLRYDVRRTNPRADRMLAEFVMAGFLRMMRRVVGPDASPIAVHFEHARPPHHAEYERFFGVVPAFSRTAPAMEFPREWLDRKQLNANERLSAVLREEARRALDLLAHQASFSDRVSRHLRAHPSHRIPSMDEAARHFGTSVRSLRRRLTEEGVSYRDLVSSVLQDAAAELLKDPYVTLADAARASGYAEVTAFHRAFKRWTGVTPKQFRRVAQ